MRKTLPSSMKSNIPKVRKDKDFRLPGYRDLEELMIEAQRLSSTTAPEVAMLCKRMRTDLRSLERRAFKDVVGLSKLITNLFSELWGFAELVEGWLRGQGESDDDPALEAPSARRAAKKGRR